MPTRKRRRAKTSVGPESIRSERNQNVHPASLYAKRALTHDSSLRLGGHGSRRSHPLCRTVRCYHAPAICECGAKGDERLSVSKSVVNDILGLFDLPGRQRMISHSDSVMYRTVLKTFSNGLFLYPNLFSVFCEGSIDATDTADMEGPDSTDRFRGLFWIKATGSPSK